MPVQSPAAAAEGTSRLRAGLIVCGFIAAGSTTALSLKWQDSMTIDGRKFAHPFMQITLAFLAASVTLAVHQHKRNKAARDGSASLLARAEAAETSNAAPERYNYMLFAAPGLLDVFATALLYVALMLTAASAVSMLRASSVIFTAALSWVTTGRALQRFEAVGILLVLVGTVSVYLAIVLFGNEEASGGHPHTGNAIAILSRMLIAAKSVAEEYVLARHRPGSYQLVGWEGVFGSVFNVFMVVVLLIVPAKLRVDDPELWFSQIQQSGTAVLATVLAFGCIVPTNVLGVIVTREASATARMVLESAMALTTWVGAMIFFGEPFLWLQLVGFVVLVLGTAVYRRVVRLPFTWLYAAADEAEAPPTADRPLFDVDVATYGALSERPPTAGY